VLVGCLETSINFSKVSKSILLTRMELKEDQRRHRAKKIVVRLYEEYQMVYSSTGYNIIDTMRFIYKDNVNLRYASSEGFNDLIICDFIPKLQTSSFSLLECSPSFLNGTLSLFLLNFG
jgi:hypothetical protein